MIRLIQRRLIVPRGDTGTFSIPVLAGKDSGDVSIFTIFDTLTHRKVFEKVMQMSNGVLSMDLTHGDTVNLPVGQYVWDIKFYSNPVFADEKLVGGTEVDSYYSAFNLPICEIRETGDNLLMAEDAPTSKLAPDQINYVEAALTEMQSTKDAVLGSVESAAASATAAEDSKEATLAAQALAEAAATSAAGSAQTATEAAAQFAIDLDTKANVADLATVATSGDYDDLINKPSIPVVPSNVSAFTNDAGYLTQHQDISGKANSADLAAVATSGSYNDLSNKPTIPVVPTDISAFNNDAGYLTQHQDISGKANSADLATVATSGSYNDLSNKPTIPSRVSDLTDDSGHYTKPANGIPAADLEETYLTQHQDISMKANSADLATVATSGSYNDLSNKPTIPDIQIEGYSIVNNGVANIPHGSDSQLGVIRTDARYGIAGSSDGVPQLSKASSLKIKQGTDEYRPIVPENQHESVFYGLAKAASDTTQSQSNNTVGIYTTEAKTAIQTMLGVPSTSAIPTSVSQLTNDAGYLTSYTETDPTVPSWAKASTKPTYTAAEVGAPTVQEMNTAIGNAIGNINSFDMAVIQALPTQDISTHTIYLVPKTGETNDVYDEYIYINNAWEMIGNTQIDLSNYATKSEIPDVPVQDVQVNSTSIVSNGVANVPIADYGVLGTIKPGGMGIAVNAKGEIYITKASSTGVKNGTAQYNPVVPYNQHESTFYGLAKAAGDSTQSSTENAVGTYTSEAKSAIRNMLGAAAASDIPSVPVQDVQVDGTSILSNGVANVPIASTSSSGVIKIGTASNTGLKINSSNVLLIDCAGATQIKQHINYTMPITPYYQNQSVFYGLAEAAGADMKDIANTTVGTYPDAQKAAIQNMLGITDLISTEETATATAAHALNSLFLMNGKLYKATAAIAIGDAVEVGTNCEVVKADEVFVKNTDYATGQNLGLVKVNTGYGITLDSTDRGMAIIKATTTQIKTGTNIYFPIVSANAHEATFYGLAKAAGDTTQATSSNAVGTYTTEAKTSIRAMIGAGTPLDVQINGTSIVSNGVASIPTSTNSQYGVIKYSADGFNGLGTSSSGNTYIYRATSAQIKTGTTLYNPIVPSNQHESAFYGLAKAAGADEKDSTLSVGTYTETAKTAIRNMLGAASTAVIAVQDEQPTNTDTKIWLPETESTGIQVPTMEDMANYVQKTDIASSTDAGIVKVIASNGISISQTTNALLIGKASSAAVKNGTNDYNPIVPSNQNEATFYGLAKAAGDTTQSASNNAVGTYTADAKAAIQTMLGVPGDVQVNETSVVSNGVANIPIASPTAFGVVKTDANSFGIKINVEGRLYTDTPNLTEIKAGTQAYKPIVPATQHSAAFYGLAKAAGDTTQSASSNAVGSYTTEAKAAIHTMLGIDPASIAAQVDIPLVETVSGTTPTITGQPNVRYVCGEVSTISITPPASGSVDVIFESGSTASVLTVPSTVKWPAWFDAEALEANTTYEVLITDGVYGSVMTWAT